jgi:hypothetical protein
MQILPLSGSTKCFTKPAHFHMWVQGKCIQRSIISITSHSGHDLLRQPFQSVVSLLVQQLFHCELEWTMYCCSQMDSISRETAIKDELLNLTRGGYCVQGHKDRAKRHCKMTRLLTDPVKFSILKKKNSLAC